MNKIQLKPIHPVFILENIIRIGVGIRFSISIENNFDNIELVKLLQNGTTLNELKVKFPNIDIDSVLDELFLLGFLEEKKDILLPDRYNVNINSYRALLPSIDHIQLHNNITNNAFLMLGMGGIGSHLLYILAELGIKKIVSVDFDIIDESNLNRQILYNTHHVGELKSDIGKSVINAFNPEIEHICLQQEICSKDDVKALIEKWEITHIINVADYPTAEIDIWVNEAVTDTKVTLIAVLIDKHDARGYIYVPGVTPCFNCLRMNEYQNNHFAQEEIDKHQNSQFRINNCALGAACMFWGYFIGYEIIRMFHMSDYNTFIQNNHFIEVDLYSSIVTRSSFEYNEECRCQI